MNDAVRVVCIWNDMSRITMQRCLHILSVRDWSSVCRRSISFYGVDVYGTRTMCRFCDEAPALGTVRTLDSLHNLRRQVVLLGRVLLQSLARWAACQRELEYRCKSYNSREAHSSDYCNVVVVCSDSQLRRRRAPSWRLHSTCPAQWM